MSITRNDFPAQLLTLVHDRMPAALQAWSQAMLAELAAIEGLWTRLQWSLGGIITLLTAWLRLSVGPGRQEDRRLDVNLIAGYQFLVSAVLIGVLTWQLPSITESWKYAVPAVIMCYAVAVLPAVLGFGLTLRDEAARRGTIIFSIVHALFNFEYIRLGLAPHAEFTAVRIVADVAIIIVLNRRTVRRVFQLSPIALHLRGDSFPPEL